LADFIIADRKQLVCLDIPHLQLMILEPNQEIRAAKVAQAAGILTLEISMDKLAFSTDLHNASRGS
jgi:hypothetical protein